MLPEETPDAVEFDTEDTPDEVTASIEEGVPDDELAAFEAANPADPAIEGTGGLA